MAAPKLKKRLGDLLVEEEIISEGSVDGCTGGTEGLWA